MAEKPILFSTEMVLAILSGNKTQTRRIIKPQPEFGLLNVNGHWYETLAPWDTLGEMGYRKDKEYKPKCQPGDILWVREMFGRQWRHGFVYRADGDSPIPEDGWKPSIHMPREAARLFLKVKNVRCERLQDISEADAVAEGVICNDAVKVSSYVYWFEHLWNSLNAKRGFGWDTNPWVWVIEFENVSASCQQVAD